MRRNVKYFILRQHPFFSDTFRLRGWQGQIDPRWICFQDFHKTPRQCVLTAELREFTPFPDMVTTPFLLLSDRMFHVADMYGEPIYSRDVVVMSVPEKESRHYHLVLPETLEDGHVRWGENHLFYMARDSGERELAASLDYVESVLRRGAIGLALEEITYIGKPAAERRGGL